MTTKIEIKAAAKKDLRKAPVNIRESAKAWFQLVSKVGLEKARKLGGKGLHDEPLKGKLKGLRSVRLSRSWRLYYTTSSEGEVSIVTIERVDKHKY